MTVDDTLTVKVSDEFGNVITAECKREDVDIIDKMITVRFTPAQTAQLESGRGRLAAYLNDLVVVAPQKVLIKGVI